MFLMTVSLSAASQHVNLDTKVDTRTLLQTDSVKSVHHFPMIIVGNPDSEPDSACVHLIESVGDSLLCDTIKTIFGNKNELVDFFIRHIVYPCEMKDLQVEDDLRLLLKLDRNGKLTESEVLNAEIPALKQEVLRVIKLLPAITTTDNKGRKIDTAIQLPISFRILKL